MQSPVAVTWIVSETNIEDQSDQKPTRVRASIEGHKLPTVDPRHRVRLRSHIFRYYSLDTHEYLVVFSQIETGFPFDRNRSLRSITTNSVAFVRDHKGRTT